MIERKITTDLFFENALPALEEVIFSAYQEWADLIPVLGKYKPGKGWGKQVTEIASTGAAKKIGEGASVIYDDIVPGNSKTFKFSKFGLGVKISEEMIDDDMWDTVNDIYRGLGSSMFYTRQQSFFDNLNNGFTVNGYDGVPLFSVNHPLVKAGGVQANRPAVGADLSVTALREAITTMSNWLTHEGLRRYWIPKYLVVSTTNVYDADELLESDYRPDTANNAINTFRKYKMESVMSPFLTDPDAWFISCSEHKLEFIDRKAPTTSSFPDFDAGAFKTKIISRWDTGHSSWYGWYGSPGN